MGPGFPTTFRPGKPGPESGPGQQADQTRLLSGFGRACPALPGFGRVKFQ